MQAEVRHAGPSHVLVVRCEPRSLVGTMGRLRKRQRVWRRELDQWLLTMPVS